MVTPPKFFSPGDYVVIGYLTDDSLPKPFPYAVVQKSLLEASYDSVFERIQLAIADQLDDDEFGNEEIRIS
jgi:hypothetical protein